jgi:hypothetical protein
MLTPSHRPAWCSANTLDLNGGGNQFESHPGHRLCWCLSCFSSVPPAKFLNGIISISHDRFLKNPFQFVIHEYSVIRHYAVWILTASWSKIHNQMQMSGSIILSSLIIYMLILAKITKNALPKYMYRLLTICINSTDKKMSMRSLALRSYHQPVSIWGHLRNRNSEVVPQSITRIISNIWA